MITNPLLVYDKQISRDFASLTWKFTRKKRGHARRRAAGRSCSSLLIPSPLPPPGTAGNTAPLSSISPNELEGGPDGKGTGEGAGRPMRRWA